MKTKQNNINKETPEDENETPSNYPEGYEEQTDATFTKFEEIGDSILGKLMDKSKSERWGFMLYTIQLQNGDMQRFHGTKQLDSLLMGSTEGDNIYVEYIDQTETQNGPMKIFKVGIKKGKHN